VNTPTQITTSGTNPGNGTALSGSVLVTGPSSRVSERNGKGRIAALDFTKGALVLVMVLYHWLNYFVSPTGFFYVYLRFLPPSFICITGFLVSQVYLSKYRTSDSRLLRRLVVRGLKILAIFTFLNVAISSMIHRPDGRRLILDFTGQALQSIYITGNMIGGRLVAFYILVPIGYLLLLCAGLLFACKYYRYTFHLATLLFLSTVLILSMNGYKSGNMELLTIGILGTSIGYIPIERIDKTLRQPYWYLLAYLGYLAAITVWDVPYPLLIPGVVLSLILLYMLGAMSGEDSRISRTIILLGKYSLFGYISQIAILQLLRRGFSSVESTEWSMGLALVLAAALTILSVEAVDRTRARIATVNRLYTAVFA